MSGMIKSVSKVIKPISTLAADIHPILLVAATALSVYATVKALDSVPSKSELIAEEEESLERQYAFSEEKRQEAERDNRDERIYNHLGFNPASVPVMARYLAS